jgi:rRNA maturation endonuclease Nob1
MSSNRDLRGQMDSDAVAMAFGKLISGKSNYRAVIERRVEKVYCSGCKKQLEGEEKFCPECGTKVVKQGQVQPSSDATQA